MRHIMRHIMILWFLWYSQDELRWQKYPLPFADLDHCQHYETVVKHMVPDQAKLFTFTLCQEE